MKRVILLVAAALSLAGRDGHGADEGTQVVRPTQRQGIRVLANEISHNVKTGEMTLAGNVQVTLEDGKSTTTLRTDQAVLRTADASRPEASLTRTGDTSAQATLKRKLTETVIPALQFQSAALDDVVAFLSEKCSVNIVLTGSRHASAPSVTMKLAHAPLYEALRLVCEVTGSKLRIDDHSVVITRGKGTPPNTYGVKLKVAPAGNDTNQFAVEFRITEKQPDDKENLLCAPKLTILGGHEGTIKVCDEGERNGIICTATVTPQEDGLQVDTSVTIKQEGEVLWSCSQETTVNN